MLRREEKSKGIKKISNFLIEVFKEFLQDDCPRLAAGIAFYTSFSLPPLLIFIIQIAGFFVPPEDIQGHLLNQVQGFLGQEGVQQIRTIIEYARQPVSSSSQTFIWGIAVLLFSATGAFLSLQAGINLAWEVIPDPAQGGAIKNLLLKRLLSLSLILVVILLLLISLTISGILAAISGLLTAFSGILAKIIPGEFSAPLLFMLYWLVSFGIALLLFAAMFKILPDAQITWRDVCPGATFSAFLFVAGKDLFALYIGNSNPGNAFGAASSFVIILLWIYYTSLVILLGAEFTQVWTRKHGKKILPVKGAIRYKKQTIHEEPDVD